MLCRPGELPSIAFGEPAHAAQENSADNPRRRPHIRRKADEMIVEGRVTLNGIVINDLTLRADPEKDHIKVDGKLLRPAEEAKFLFPV